MQVKIYSTPTCYYCVKAKQYFQSKGISYIDLDVSANEAYAQEMIRKTGQMGVPVIEIKNQTIIGFNKSKIEQLLNTN